MVQSAQGFATKEIKFFPQSRNLRRKQPPLCQCATFPPTATAACVLRKQNHSERIACGQPRRPQETSLPASHVTAAVETAPGKQNRQPCTHGESR